MVIKNFQRESRAKPYLQNPILQKIENSIEGVTYVTKFFWKMEILTLRAKF